MCILYCVAHAGGALTNGPLQDIEELGVTVVVCPLHRYLVSIRDGKKVYQAVEINRATNKTEISGWRIGKVVQRCHEGMYNEETGEILVVSSCLHA